MTVRSFRRLVAAVSAAIAITSVSSLPAYAEQAHDIVFVIDNSASMRGNDRTYRAPQALIDTLWRLDGDARMGIILFGADPELVAPLTPVSPANRPALMAATDRVRYAGRRTNPASAVERAIYHLRFDGRPGAEKWIVLLSDGNVDIGSRRRNRDLQKWLAEDLTRAAVDDGIRVIGIAFTDGADHRMLQQVAARTGGEFIPVFNDRDVTRGFRRVVEVIEQARAGEASRDTLVPSDAAVASTEHAAAQPSIVDVVPRTSSTGSMMSPGAWLAGLAGLAAVGGLVLLFVLKIRRTAPVGPTRKAILLDRSGVSGRGRYELDGTPVVIGRRPGDHGNNAVRIVLDRKTISRRHAVIVFRDYGYWIADQGTKNGTYVNGERVVGQRKLEHADVITIEDFEFQLCLPDAEDDDRTLYRGEDVDETLFKADEIAIPSEAGVDVRDDDRGEATG